MANVRIRGKIPREEWPKIAARFQNGETLTEIARSYHCTAPAIRYIVGRVSIRGGKAKMDRDKSEKVAVLPPPTENRRPTRVGNIEDRSYISEDRNGFSPDPDEGPWNRVNTDATFRPRWIHFLPTIAITTSKPCWRRPIVVMGERAPA